MKLNNRLQQSTPTMKSPINVKSVIMLFGLLTLNQGCGNKGEDVDLVKGIAPVQNIPANAAIQLDSLAITGDKKHLNKAIDQLGMNMFERLHIDPNTTKSINYEFVSKGTNISALDAQNLLHQGHVNNEVLATVTFNDGSRKEYFLRCANGAATEKGSVQSSNLASEQVVVIETGDNLRNHYGSDSYKVALEEEVPLFYRDPSNHKFRHYLYTEEEIQNALNNGHKIIADVKKDEVILH